jgi:very-short-patch-repair endonuclease
MYRDEEQRDFARQLRSECTEAEKNLWYFLRGNKLGVKFRRQAAIGVYVVDFVCFSNKLIVSLTDRSMSRKKAKPATHSVLLS